MGQKLERKTKNTKEEKINDKKKKKKLQPNPS
jgi:hypothetical protein